MRVKNVIAAMLFFVSILCLSSCVGNESDTANELYVGVTCYDLSDAFVSELLECFKASCNDREITVTIRDAVGAQRTQNDQVQELIDEGCNVLCVNLVDRTDPSEIIDMAREREVPIIFFNREPVAEDLRQWDNLYYVGAYSRQSGVMQGELAAETIWKNKSIDRNKDGKIQYVMLEGETGHQDSVIRTEYAVNTLKEKGIELERLSYGIANWNRVQAQNRMSQMLSRHGEEIELVLSNNDDMALGAIDAYMELDVEETNLPAFFGIDGISESLEAVKDGTMTATVYNNKEGQAEAMTELSYSLMTGKEMKNVKFENGQCVYMDYVKVTPDNVKEFLAREKEQ